MPGDLRGGQYRMEPVGNLTLHPKNPRRGDIPAIAAAIRQNGFYGAVVAQRSTGHVVAGNHRLQAAIEAGLEEVPVLWLDIDDDQALRILLVDNRSSDQSSYDELVLIEDLRQLKQSDVGLLGTGFADRDLNRLLSSRAQQTRAAGAAAFGWRLIVDCETEEQQAALAAELSSLGYKAKARVVE